MDEQLDLLRRGLAGRLAVGTFQSASAELLPNMLARMRADTPDVEVRLFETDDLDELVGQRPRRRDRPRVHRRHHRRPPPERSRSSRHDPFVVLAPARRRVPGPTVHADDLRSKPLIGQPGVETVQRMVDERLQQAGIVADYAFRFRNNAAVQTMVRTGMGWAVMPSLAVDHDDPDIGIHHLEPPLPPRAIQLIRKHGRTLPPGSRSVPGDRRRGRATTCSLDERAHYDERGAADPRRAPAARCRPRAAAVGQNVLLTVLFKQVFDLTGNPLDIAFIGLAQFVPALLLVLVSGWVADRFDRRRVAGLVPRRPWAVCAGADRVQHPWLGDRLAPVRHRVRARHRRCDAGTCPPVDRPVRGSRSVCSPP